MHGGVRVWSKITNGCCIGKSTTLTLPGLLPNQKRDLESRITRYADCEKGSSAHNKDVLLADGKYQKLSACCTSGYEGIFDTLSSDGTLVCFKNSNGYWATGDDGATQGIIGGAKCKNGATKCTKNPDACCSGAEYTKTGKRTDYLVPSSLTFSSAQNAWRRCGKGEINATYNSVA